MASHSQFGVLDEVKLAGDKLGRELDHFGTLGTTVAPQAVPDHLGEPYLRLPAQNHL